jgi:hypothetical protein
VLLQVLIRYFIHGTESDDELTILSNVGVDTMFQLIKQSGAPQELAAIGANARQLATTLEQPLNMAPNTH